MVLSAVALFCDSRVSRPLGGLLAFDDVLEYDGGHGRKREWVDVWILVRSGIARVGHIKMATSTSTYLDFLVAGRQFAVVRNWDSCS